MKKKILNLGLVLSLTLVVGFSFFSSMEEASANININPSEVECWDYPPVPLHTVDTWKRKCKNAQNCPWAKVWHADMTKGKCNI